MNPWLGLPGRTVFSFQVGCPTGLPSAAVSRNRPVQARIATMTATTRQRMRHLHDTMPHRAPESFSLFPIYQNAGASRGLLTTCRQPGGARVAAAHAAYGT